MSMSDDLTTDSRQMVQRVIRRDRRRMRTLAVLTIGLWVIATLFITSVYLPIGGRMNESAKLLLAADPNAVQRRLTPREMEQTPDPVPADQVPATLARVRHAQRIQTEFMF